METPPTTTVPDAVTVNEPTVVELTITVHVPAAPVAPLGPEVPPVIEPTPVEVDPIVMPLAGVQPVPSFFSTVTVKVCALPTLFEALAPRWIGASPHVFTLLISWFP